LLFIHTNNHGDTDSTGAFIGYPEAFPSGPNVNWSLEWVNLYASTFGELLAELPKFRTLMVMMEQCGSGGFGPDVLSNSTARETTFAAACLAGSSSYITSDGLWDGFALEWIAGMNGQNPDGSALASNPDTDGSLNVDAHDAYNFAAHYDPCTGDSPNFSSSSARANKTSLAEPYELYWFWCWIINSYGSEFYESIRHDPELRSQYYHRLNAAVPALHEAIAPVAEKTMLDARRQLAPAVKTILKEAMSGLPPKTSSPKSDAAAPPSTRSKRRHSTRRAIP
jgi:hypothetical protein